MNYFFHGCNLSYGYLFNYWMKHITWMKFNYEWINLCLRMKLIVCFTLKLSVCFWGLGDLGFLGFLRSFFFDDIALDGVVVVVSARRGRGLAFYYLLSPSSQVIKNAPSPSLVFHTILSTCLFVFACTCFLHNKNKQKSRVTLELSSANALSASWECDLVHFNQGLHCSVGLHFVKV